MNPERQLQLERRISKADQAMRFTFAGMVLAIVALLCFVVVLQFQLQQQIKDSLASSKITAAANHKRTQEFVRCTAIATTVPIAQRIEALNKCGIDVDTNDTPLPSIPSAVPQSKPNTTTSSNAPVATGGPDPIPNNVTNTQTNNNPITTPTPASSPSSPSVTSGIPILGPVIDGIKQIL